MNPSIQSYPVEIKYNFINRTENIQSHMLHLKGQNLVCVWIAHCSDDKHGY